MADTPSGPQPAARRSRSALLKRLPLLALVALGLWLWQATGTPERELVFRLVGYEWAHVRAMDFQVVAENGEVVKREERFFASGPPPELTFKVDLPEGPWRARFFVQHPDYNERLQVEEPLVVGQERYIVRQLRLPFERR